MENVSANNEGQLGAQQGRAVHDWKPALGQ
jgi:hypothetical protein